MFSPHQASRLLKTFDFSLIKPVFLQKKCSWSASDPKVIDSLKLDVVSGETWQPVFLWFLFFFSPSHPLPPPPLCWMFVSGRVSPLVGFHTNHSVTSEHGRPWRTAKARAFEMSNLFLRWEGRWSLKRLFIMHSAECGGCLQLSASSLLLEASARGGEAQSRGCLNSRVISRAVVYFGW